jgi:hypothetical protein
VNELGYFISDLTSLIPVAAGLNFFKRLKADRRLILYFLIYTSFVELSNAWMAWHHQRDLWSINIFTLAEYSLYAFILNKWVKGGFMKWMTLVGSLLFYLIWLGYLIFYKSLSVTYTAADVTESAVLMLLSCFALTTISLQTESSVLKDYCFWFSAVAFTYFAVSVLLSVVMTRLLENPNAYEFDAWSIHTVINIASNLAFAYMFFLK